VDVTASPPLLQRFLTQAGGARSIFIEEEDV